MPKIKQTEKTKRRRQICDFARDHNLVINPGCGFDYYINAYYESGGRCPCDATRVECPCPESIDEVKKNGACKCRLFWRDLDTYKASHLKEG